MPAFNPHPNLFHTGKKKSFLEANETRVVYCQSIILNDSEEPTMCLLIPDTTSGAIPTYHLPRNKVKENTAAKEENYESLAMETVLSQYNIEATACQVKGALARDSPSSCIGFSEEKNPATGITTVTYYFLGTAEYDHGDTASDVDGAEKAREIINSGVTGNQSCWRLLDDARSLLPAIADFKAIDMLQGALSLPVRDGNTPEKEE